MTAERTIPTPDERAKAEAWADRLLQLLDVALAAVAADDFATATMALKEGLDSAPKKRTQP